MASYFQLLRLRVEAMHANVRSPVFVLAAILVAISTLGAVVAGQQYFFLQMAKDAVLSQRLLEETFFSTIKIAAGGTVPEVEKEVVAQSARMEQVGASVTALVGQVEKRAVADFVGWCVTWVLSSMMLFIGRKRGPLNGQPHSVPH